MTISDRLIVAVIGAGITGITAACNRVCCINMWRAIASFFLWRTDATISPATPPHPAAGREATRLFAKCRQLADIGLVHRKDRRPSMHSRLDLQADMRC